jgi:thiamine kinase-like enzyme
LRHLRRLKLARGPIAIERIAGGISNHNFVVRTAASTFVALLCQERRYLGIDRRNESVCQQAACAAGVAPEVLHHEDGLLMSRFVAGRTLQASDLRRPEMLVRLAALLRCLHESWSELTGEILYFCPFQSVRTYAQTAARVGAVLPRDIHELFEDTRALSRRIAPSRPVLCHNDLLAANLIDDGTRLSLVDWEYAGMGNPLFDLANASANAALSEEQETALLAAYAGNVDARSLAELRIFRAISALREALWSTIQTVASDIEFDYLAYAADNLRAYRAARARLDPGVAAPGAGA